MAHAMSQFKATANSHMRRDMEAGGKWVCACEACEGIRSLVGMEKVLAIRPLVRVLQETEERLDELPDAEERRALVEQYLKLHDQLADELAR
jgi:hypothetical protein